MDQLAVCSPISSVDKMLNVAAAKLKYSEMYFEGIKCGPLIGIYKWPVIGAFQCAVPDGTPTPMLGYGPVGGVAPSCPDYRSTLISGGTCKTKPPMSNLSASQSWREACLRACTLSPIHCRHPTEV
ncbi:hypothetical protein CHS0354_038689 [Potamilus streckersoni]|uniref:Uncharacterized protein n=1 Tax=Potamilus streckersoni TaxID=2493646 RepID=A0AAE0VVQ5_9BIVA|nr:hypothetical protein CHS0354_038689 [Potamilus streckersoni]